MLVEVRVHGRGITILYLIATVPVSRSADVYYDIAFEFLYDIVYTYNLHAQMAVWLGFQLNYTPFQDRRL